MKARDWGGFQTNKSLEEIEEKKDRNSALMKFTFLECSQWPIDKHVEE